jgi:hypothetical protein
MVGVHRADRHFLVRRMVSGQIRTLVRIAAQATECQIVRAGFSMVLLGNDVVDPDE